MSAAIKLSSPATREFWEIPILFEDEHVLALDKPVGLAISPNPNEPKRASLMALLHAAIAAGKPWASERGLSYLAQSHRLDAETGGVLLLAKSKPVLAALTALFGSEKPLRNHLALVKGVAREDTFEVTAAVASDPLCVGRMRLDSGTGKRARTLFTVQERFKGHALIACQPLTDRPHQIRLHLRRAGLRLLGDHLYDGPDLLLSQLKPNYRLKPKQTEQPLVGTVALHSASLDLVHPITGAPLSIAAPLTKHFAVALKFLRLYAAT